jgi:hypothetical protein
MKPMKAAINLEKKGINRFARLDKTSSEKTSPG